MHEYDTVLKALLQRSQNSSFEHITGEPAGRWLNVEFPEVQQTRVDLLFETADGARLIGLELQSGNDIHIPLRMAEYALRVYRAYGRFPKQYVLYVGNDSMRIPSELSGPNFLCRYSPIDIRTLDEETLLASPFAADHILAILANHRDQRETIQRILAGIATLEGSARDTAFRELIILAGLRKLETLIETEVKQMPILNDIMDHDIIGPAIRRGLEQGKQEGELNMLRLLTTKRFGPLPSWAEDRLTRLSSVEIETLSLRLLDAQSLEELFSSR